MAKGDFYFPLHYQKLLVSTNGWKDDEFGAYVRLLISQFDKGSIPKDINELARIAPSIKKNWKRIESKFMDDGGGNLINPFMDEIRQDVNYKKDKNKTNGGKGGRPKKVKINNPTETETEPNGFKNETQTKAILIDNSKYIKERENPPKTFWEKEEDKTHSLQHCMTIALRDEGWVSVNKTNRQELEQFNVNLKGQGTTEKKLLDYKKHFFHWKKKLGGDLVPLPTSASNHREDKGRDIMNQVN